MYEKNIFFYERDSRGNEANIEKQDVQLRNYVQEEFGEANIKIYKDKCGLLEKREGLESLLNDIKKQRISWIIATHSNRFYRVNYEDGEKRLLNLLKEIHSSGANIAFSSELVKLENEEQIDKYVKY